MILFPENPLLLLLLLLAAVTGRSGQAVEEYLVHELRGPEKELSL